MTVSQRIDQLKQEINTDSQNAILASDELAKQNPNLDQQLQQTTNALQSAAQQIGLNYQDPNFPQELQSQMQNAAGNPQELAYLQQVQDLANQQELLQSQRFAPATARMSYAMLMSEGMTDNPEASMQAQMQNGAPQPSNQELNDAFMLMRQAGDPIRKSPTIRCSTRSTPTLPGNMLRLNLNNSAQIATDLQQANAAANSGDKTSAEKFYQEAWKTGEGIDQKFILAQLQIPDNANNPQIAQALVGILSNVKEARLDYANFLNGEGKFSQALPIALSVGAQTPQLAQQDPTYSQIVQKATFGDSVPQSDLQSLQAQFAQEMQDKKFTEASKTMDSLKKNFQDMKSTLDQDNAAMEKNSKSVSDQLTQLNKNQANLDPTEYQIQKQQLQAEQAQIKQIHDADQQAQQQYAYLQYLQGVLAYSKDDKKTAYNLFQEAEKGDPSLEKQSSLKLNALMAATKPEGWFERNWKAVATVGAVVAGVAVGIGVGIFTAGVGGVVAGAGTTAGLMAAIGGGAIAGGLAYSGIKGGILGFNQVGWKDVAEGGFIGATSAVTAGTAATAFGGAAAATDVAGTSAATEAGDAAASGGFWSNGLTMNVGKFGLQFSGRTLAYGLGTDAAYQGYKVGFDGQSWGNAAKSFAIEDPLFVGGSALAAGSGMTMAKVEITADRWRLEWLPEVLLGAG